MVLDHAETLRTKDSHLLSALMSLGSMEGINVCTVLVSHLSWVDFMGFTSLEPHQGI